jgi:hypothetical protein
MMEVAPAMPFHPGENHCPRPRIQRLGVCPAVHVNDGDGLGLPVDGYVGVLRISPVPCRPVSAAIRGVEVCHAGNYILVIMLPTRVNLTRASLARRATHLPSLTARFRMRHIFESAWSNVRLLMARSLAVPDTRAFIDRRAQGPDGHRSAVLQMDYYAIGYFGETQGTEGSAAGTPVTGSQGRIDGAVHARLNRRSDAGECIHDRIIPGGPRDIDAMAGTLRQQPCSGSAQRIQRGAACRQRRAQGSATDALRRRRADSTAHVPRRSRRTAIPTPPMFCEARRSRRRTRRRNPGDLGRPCRGPRQR